MVLMPYFSNFQRKLLVGSHGAGRSSKTFPDMPNEFRESGCKQESRQADWECGVTFNCLPFQAHRILWHRAGNSPCLVVPEFEPYADSL